MDTLENAQKRAEYWKAEHTAANVEIETLRQRVNDCEETINTYVGMLNERDAALISMADKCTACGKELTAERDISDKLEKVLRSVGHTFVYGDKIEVTTIIQNALAELAAMRKGETE